MNRTTPVIKPIDTKDYEVKQSKYDTFLNYP